MYVRQISTMLVFKRVVTIHKQMRACHGVWDGLTRGAAQAVLLPRAIHAPTACSPRLSKALSSSGVELVSLDTFLTFPLRLSSHRAGVYVRWAGWVGMERRTQAAEAPPVST